MIFAQRRKLLKFAAIMPLATLLRPVNASSSCGFDQFIQEIIENEQLFMQIGKALQDAALPQSSVSLRQQIMLETGCLESKDKTYVEKTILAKVQSDFKKERIINYKGWILSQTEVDICRLAYLT